MTDLRPATPDDHDPVVALPDLGGATRRLLAKDLAGEVPRHAVVAVDDGEVVAFAMETRQPDEVHLLDIVVRPDHRRRGIGRRLVTTLAALGAADGATAMTLEARVSNPGGPPMYRDLGFTDSGIRPGYYQDGEDAFVMWHHDLALLARSADPGDLAAVGVAADVVAPVPTGPVRVPDLEELEAAAAAVPGDAAARATAAAGPAGRER